jgi:putative FmdB family regulatory protein
LVPIYDYTCVACGHEVEVIHSVHADSPACPECGGQMKKALVAPAVHFKGSGWARKEVSGAGKSRGGPKNSDSPTESSKSSAESSGADAAPKSDPAGDRSSGEAGSMPESPSSSSKVRD